MKNKVTLALMFFVLTFMGYSQTESGVFKPNGKPLALLYPNFHADFSNGETTAAFEMLRAYLGYEYSFSKDWSAKIVFDVADPGNDSKLQMTAFLKNAYFSYKKNRFSAYFGMIATTQFKVSENIWGNRYLEKSFQDAYNFNASADLGFNLEYELADFASVDFSVINGEGYKKLQSDKYLRPGFGITINPLKNITARIYADTYGDAVKQKSLATFAAYTGQKLVISAEYNFQKNHDMAENENLSGMSFFINCNISKKVKLIGRYDNLMSNTVSGASHEWNITSDGKLILAGLEFSPVKGVKLTPNFRGWSSADKTQKFITSFYFNCELKF